MAIVRARSPFVWVRRVLFAFGILAVLGVGLLFAAYRFGSAGRGVRPSGDVETPAAGRTDEATVTAGEGFDYTQTSGSRKVFRLRAARSRQDREEMAYLEQVLLEIYRQDGDVYTVTSHSARVNQRNWDAELEGDVIVTGWEELELRARALKLENEGQVLTSIGAVEFRSPPDLVGRASELRFDHRVDSIHLSGGVHIKSVPEAEVPMRLDCERLAYLRSEGLIRAFEDVYLRHGDQEIETYALSLFLDEVPGSSPPRRGLRTLRARWDVRGRLASADPFAGDRRVEFSGQLLEVTPTADDSSIRRIQLEGGAGEAAVVKIVEATGVARRITGDRLESRARGGELHQVQGTGDPLILDEFLDFDEPFPLRQACARQLVASFLPDGRLGRIDLKRQVELNNGDLYLSGGSRAGLDLEAETIEIRGSPGVELYHSRGTVTAPHLSYSQEKGILRASSGVQATLRQTAPLEATPLGRGGGPVHVEAEEALLTEAPPAYSFRGGVRAWRGENLLLADQLRADQDSGEMSASGAVKTVWFPGAADPPATLRSAPRQPIEVTSDNLSYRAPASQDGGSGRPGAPASAPATLVYSGRVEVRQDQRTIRCGELAVELAAPGDDRPADGSPPEREDSPRRMICRGDVQLLDPAAGRRVRGDTAVYAVADQRLEVYGREVELRDEDQNTLVGRYLLYDLDAGTVQLRSRAPSVELP